MIELHLIGYTSDLRYLVLDLDPEGERGRYRLVVDGDLLLTLDELRDLRAQAGMDVGVPYERLEERLGVTVRPPAPEQTAPVPTTPQQEAPRDQASSALPVEEEPPVQEEPPAEEPPVEEPPPPPPEDPASTIRLIDVPETGDPEAAVERGGGDDEPGEGDGEPEVPEEPPDEPEPRPARREERVQPEAPAPPPRPGRTSPGHDSELSPAQIQARLRAGRRPESVAEEAGTDVAWVERWLPPILTERAQVLQEAQALHLERPRKGRSHAPLGEAVAANLRRRHLDPDEDAEWSVKRRANGRWSINVRYRYRNRTRSATWALDREEGELSASSDAARDLGWTDGA